MSVFGKEWRFMASEPVAVGGLSSQLVPPRSGASKEPAVAVSFALTSQMGSFSDVVGFGN